jgi:hypothetical protein
MKKLNEGFTGNPCYVAQFGDSITYSAPFWKPLNWAVPEQYLPDDGFPKAAKTVYAGDKRWRDLLKGMADKGTEFANMSAWKIEDLLAAVPGVLKRNEPEMAIIMIGTNGTHDKKPGNYRANLEKIIKMCLDAHCIPILNTIPPKRGCDAGVAEVNADVRELAQQYKVPLVDYHAEIVKRQPVPACFDTLIEKDGVHPTAGDTVNFSEENLNISGYALRTWVNFLTVREIFFRILNVARPYVEEVGTVEPVRTGLRCEVVADTQVSKYHDANDDERLWNWGAAPRLKIKGCEEYTLLKFDTAKAKGMAVKRATLYLSRTEECVTHVSSISTISSDWSEGKGAGSPGKLPPAEQGRASKGGATFSHAVYPEVTWAGPGSSFKSVMNGHGGSLWQALNTGWATNEAGQQYYTVDLPPEIAQALLIEGDSYGLSVADEKGQRMFHPAYRRKPTDNHFLNSRESGKPCFLVIEGEKAPKQAVKTVAGATGRTGAEAGSVVLEWTCPAGDKLQGYRVYVAKEKLSEKTLSAKTLLPRSRTWRPLAPGARQEFLVEDLEPGVEYHFAVTAYDRYGNISEPVFVSAKSREERKLALAVPGPQSVGAPLENAALRLWACGSNERINPVNGNAISEGKYAAAAGGEYRKGNEAWDGKRQVVTLCAGRNDFAGFQLALENRGNKPLTGLKLVCSDFNPVSPAAELARHVRLSAKDPGKFMAAMTVLEKKDPPAAVEVFATLKRYNELKARQQADPKAFFDEMTALRASNEAEYTKWMGLLGEGEAAGAGIAAKNVELFWAWNLKAKDGAWYPDPLVPLSGVVDLPNSRNAVPGQKVQAFYVDVFVPHKTEPGKYRGELLVRAEGAEEIAVPVELTVAGHTLPDTLSFVCEMNGYNYPPAKDWEGALNLHRLAHRNRLNINIVPYSQFCNWSVPQMAMQVSGKGKGMRVQSFESFDKHFGPLLDGSAFAECPRAGVPVPALYLGLYDNWPCSLKGGFVFDQSGKQLDLRRDFTQEYKDGFVAVCKQMGTHFTSRGYTRTALQVFPNNKYALGSPTFWLLDEPMHRDDYLALQFYGDLVREGFKDSAPVRVDYRVDLSRSEEARGMFGAVDTVVLSQGNMREYPQVTREFMRDYAPRRPGEARVGWEYGGAGSPLQSPSTQRGWVLECWLLGRDGLLPWLAYGENNAWDSAEAAHDAVFYPALSKWGYNGCYGSLRMKAFRDGQQDVERLRLLADKLGASRQDVVTWIKPFVALKGSVATATVDVRVEDAGTISYTGLTPDKLGHLRAAVIQALEEK